MSVLPYVLVHKAYALVYNSDKTAKQCYVYYKSIKYIYGL